MSNRALTSFPSYRKLAVACIKLVPVPVVCRKIVTSAVVTSTAVHLVYDVISIINIYV